MTSQTALAAVRRTFVVDAPLERAFRVFTEELASWWPPEHSIGSQPWTTLHLEPRAGGRWFERAADGSECDWGRVLAYEPPQHLRLAWQIGPEWRFEPDLAKASEIEVRFSAEGPARTRVEFEHRHFERHAGGAAIRAAVDSPQGWTGVLERYARVNASAR